MTPKEQYEESERLARAAERNGGPLPVALLQEAADAGFAPALYALANWHLHGCFTELGWWPADLISSDMVSRLSRACHLISSIGRRRRGIINEPRPVDHSRRYGCVLCVRRAA
jgi:hypothetical protein